MSLHKRLDDLQSRLERNRGLIERVQYCIDHCAECNDWEDDFLDNLLDWLVRGRSLSSAQMIKLEEIENIVICGRDDENIVIFGRDDTYHEKS